MMVLLTDGELCGGGPAEVKANDNFVQLLLLYVLFVIITYR